MRLTVVCSDVGERIIEDARHVQLPTVWREGPAECLGVTAVPWKGVLRAGARVSGGVRGRWTFSKGR